MDARSSRCSPSRTTNSCRSRHPQRSRHFRGQISERRQGYGNHALRGGRQAHHLLQDGKRHREARLCPRVRTQLKKKIGHRWSLLCRGLCLYAKVNSGSLCSQNVFIKLGRGVPRFPLFENSMPSRISSQRRKIRRQGQGCVCLPLGADFDQREGCNKCKRIAQVQASVRKADGCEFGSRFGTHIFLQFLPLATLQNATSATEIS